MLRGLAYTFKGVAFSGREDLGTTFGNSNVGVAR